MKRRLLVVNNQSGNAIASFLYDASARAVGVIDKESSVSIDYSNPATPLVTEFFGETSSTSARALNQDGSVSSVSDGCACGPARTLKWANRRLQCVSDIANHVTWQDYDSLGRLTHRVEYVSTQGCPTTGPSSVDPSQSRQEWRTYGVTRAIAQGVNLALDDVTSISRTSILSTSNKLVETYSYDPAPQAIDPAGYACQESPLPAGSVVCRRIESGYTYNASGSVISERHATFFAYDARGRLTKTLGPVNLDYPSASDVMPVEERSYWPDTDTLARRGRLHQVMRYALPTATLLVTSYDYDAFGPFQITHPNGETTLIVKDGRGRAIVTVSPAGGFRQVRYQDGLEPRIEILASGATVRSGYDSAGRLASREYLSGDPELPGANPSLAWGEYYAYDTAGNRIHTERRDADGTVTWQQDRQYDVQHRLVSDTNPESPSAARANVFDSTGFLQSMTDEEGRATTYTPDGLNRVKKVTRSGLDADGVPTSLDVAQYTYNYYGDSISKVLDGSSKTTSYQYDDFGRTMSVTSASQKGGALQLRYDARGNLVLRKDQYVTVNYTYDGLDRILTLNAANSADGSSIAYTYVYDEPGSEGQLSNIVEPDRTMRYGYDGAGRLTSERIEENGVAVPLVTQYVRDGDGAVSNVTYSSGLQIQLVRDPATGEIVQVKNVADGANYADQASRLPGGPLKSMTFGNGATLAQSFNRRYEPQAISSGPLEMSYGMTPSGDVASVSEATVRQNFSYDFLNRLVTLGYDLGGAPSSSVAVDGGPGTYSYNYGRVTGMFDPSGASRLAYAYDYQSNLSGIRLYVQPYGAMCFVHDPLGRMVLAGSTSTSSITGDATACTSAAAVTGARTSFKYDSRNRRVARQDPVSGQWTYVVPDVSGNPLSELQLTSDPANPWRPVRDYVWLDGRPLAQIEYPGPAGGAQGYVYYYHVDHLGLPRYLTNASQQVVWSGTKRPYGDIYETTTVDPISGRTVATNLRLPGQYDERLLGSLGVQGPYYNWNRWYLPSVGRYLELDPLALRGKFNGSYGPDWYNYVEGNPLSYIDPFGLDRYDSCNNKDLGWLGKWICKKGIDKECSMNPAFHEQCCEADRNDCRTQKQPGCDGWDQHMAKCEAEYQKCMLELVKPKG